MFHVFGCNFGFYPLWLFSRHRLDGARPFLNWAISGQFFDAKDEFGEFEGEIISAKRRGGVEDVL